MKKMTARLTPKMTALLAVLMATTLGLSACSKEKAAGEGDSGEVMAVDRVNEAEDIAQANAPEAEDLGFTNNAGIQSTDGAEGSAETTDGAATGDAAASEVKSADGEAKADGAAADMSTGDATGMDPAAAGADAGTEEAHTAPTSK